MAFPGLPRGFYGVIYVDPPWSFKSYSGPTLPHRTEEAPYEVMSLDDLKALPVAELAARDCGLFLWTFGAHFEQAFEIGKAWGFKFKTKAFEWVKTTKDGNPKMGMGHWSRQESESVLLFTRGSPKRIERNVRSTIWEPPANKHSRKPEECAKRIERLMGGPYVELFATRYRRGWSVWGDGLPREWKKIQNFDYEVSDDGQVRRIGSSLLLSQDLNSKGYLRVDLHKDGVRYRKFVHKLVCVAFNENPENKPWPDHKDRNRQNNHKDNLRWSWKHENGSNRPTNGNFRGISLHHSGGWAAYGSAKGNKTIYLGKRDTPQEAAALYDAWALEKYGEFAILNFPEGR